MIARTVVTLAVASSACASHVHSAPTAHATPTDQVIALVEKTHLYPEGVACLAFAPEGAGDVVVRERHGGGCPGDPGVEPVRDRFRVLPSGEIQRYEPATDAYLSMSTVALTWRVRPGDSDVQAVELVATIEGVAHRIALPAATGALLPENQRVCGTPTPGAVVARLSFYEGGTMDYVITRSQADRLEIARTLESDGLCDADCPVSTQALRSLAIPSGATIAEAITIVDANGAEDRLRCP